MAETVVRECAQQIRGSIFEKNSIIQAKNSKFSELFIIYEGKVLKTRADAANQRLKSEKLYVDNEILLGKDLIGDESLN